jgi:uncharacterized protein (DUF1501 family)
MRIETFFTTRREFLGGTLRVLSAAATLPVFLGRTASALAAPSGAAQGRDDAGRILVVVQLSGGNDGLNTVVPYENELYYRLRPRLAIPKDQVLPLQGGVGLHPAATGLKALYDAGRLAIIQGVGYPNPNRSHFVSMDVWHTADPDLRKHAGWLGRYVDACCAGADPQPDPLAAIALDRETPLALQGARFAPLAFKDVEDLAWRGGRRDARAAAAFQALNAAAPATQPTTRPTAAESTRQFLQRAALDALAGGEEIRTAAGAALRSRRERRDNRLAAELGLTGRMIRAALPTRIYYVSLGGFDTHANQLGRQQQLLRQLADALQDFIDDLADDGLLDRVLVLGFSEFGRRVPENASGGTDHGAAAPVFLAGGGLRPGLHGAHPDLARLDGGDLAFGCDFRRVYATILRDWLAVRPAQVNQLLGGSFAPLELFVS